MHFAPVGAASRVREDLAHGAERRRVVEKRPAVGENRASAVIDRTSGLPLHPGVVFGLTRAHTGRRTRGPIEACSRGLTSRRGRVLRSLREEDYPQVIRVLDDWWGGRQMTNRLPRLFFQHFADTSFAIEEERRVIAFLVGFISQARPGEAYIHFMGVDPACRGRGFGRMLYERFFTAAKERGATSMHCITSPVNKGSVAFHRAMGFDLAPGDTEIDGVPVHADYDGRGGPRVVFLKEIV